MENKQNREAFLALVRAGLWEQDVQLLPYGDVDYSEIYRLAEEQSVIGLVTAGIEHVVDVKVPKDNVLTFVGRSLQIERRNIEMNHFLAVLARRFRDEKIDAILVKGQGVAQCYERPLWRSSGDIDLILNEKYYPIAKNYLSRFAVGIEEEYAYTSHIAMSISGWEIELHGNLRTTLSKRIDKELDDVLDDTFFNNHIRKWRNEDIDVLLPSPDNDVIFIFTHILQHFFKWGIGLRQICDWCRLLWTYKDSLNQELLELRIRQMGLMSEWKAFAAFAVSLLGIPQDAMPLYDSKPCWRKKALRILSCILKAGNLGHNRDMSYLKKYPFVVRKMVSLWHHTCDGMRHFGVFPMDSAKIWGRMLTRGVKIAVVGDR